MACMYQSPPAYFKSQAAKKQAEESSSSHAEETPSLSQSLMQSVRPGDTEKDLDDEVSPVRCAIYLVFYLFALGGQAMMSFDGGATFMSQKALRSDGWSDSLLGILSAMDKFGQTLCAPFWGPLLGGSRVKWFVFGGLLLKAISCFGFGNLSEQPSMLLCKFGMGAFEALVGIWAVTWINAKAPNEKAKGQWQGFMGIAAGFGSGLGSAVAGYCSEPIGYEFAFNVQASILVVVSVCLSFSPPQLLQATPDQTETSESSWKLARNTVSNRLWLFTGLSMWSCTFIMTGVQQTWQNTTHSVWGFTDAQSTVLLLLIMSFGGLLGVVFGPRVFTFEFTTDEGASKKFNFKVAHECLRTFSRVTLCISIAATFCALLLLRKVQVIVYSDINEQDWIKLLCIVCFLLFVVMALINSMMGIMTNIMLGAVPPAEGSIAVGLGQAMNNIIGMACGMMFPQLLAELVGLILKKRGHKQEAIEPSQYATAMALPLGGAWMLHLCMVLAAGAAKKRVPNPA